EREAQWGAALAQSADATATIILDALMCGADAAAAYRALASVLPGTHPATSAMVEASLLLAPDRPMTHLTRALLRFQQGDLAGALGGARSPMPTWSRPNRPRPPSRSARTPRSCSAPSTNGRAGTPSRPIPSWKASRST